MGKENIMGKEKVSKRRKPNFLRKDWHKKIRLGSTVKKKRKWKKAYGRHNKIRLGRKGHSVRPKIGWGSAKKEKAVRIENLRQLESLEKGQEIIIASVGKKKKESLIKKASEMNLKILNNYRREKNATK